MAWMQSDLDALKAAIAQGASRVKFADREVTYRSLAEMLETQRLIEGELAAAAGVQPRKPRQIRFVTGHGLY